MIERVEPPAFATVWPRSAPATAVAGPRALPAARAKLPVAMLVIAVLGIALCRVEVLTSEWGFDAGAWLYISQLMGEGYKPYVDVWDNKLPPVLWIGRLVLASGAPHVAMFVVDLFFTLLGVLGIAVALRGLGAARRTALFFGGLHVLAALPAWQGAHRIEVYATGCVAAALALVVRAEARGGSLRLGLVAGAGALMAAAASFRLQEALSAVVLAMPVALLGSTRRAPLSAYGLGAACGVLALGLAATAGGYLEAMLRAGVRGGVSFAAGAERPGLAHLGKTLNALRENVGLMSIAWLSAGAGSVLASGVYRGLGRRERLLAFTALALFLIHAAVALFGGHQWMHHYYPAGWSGALLLGAGFVLWKKRQAPFRALPRRTPEVLLASAFLAVAPFNARVYAGLQRLATDAPPSRTDQVELLIRAHVPSHEGALLAEGYDAIGALLRLPHPPGSYWAAWAPQCRYESPGESRGESQARVADADPFFVTGCRWGARLIDCLERDGTRWIVRERGKQDALSAALERDYAKTAESADFELWRRSN